MKYDVDYFINKFKAIPENLWCVNTRSNGTQRCALGWCYPTHEEASKSETDIYGVMDSTEDKCLGKLFNTNLGLTAPSVNNGTLEAFLRYPQPSPKQRILAALYDIKKLKNTEVKEIIRYVAVSEKIRKEVPESLEQVN